MISVGFSGFRQALASLHGSVALFDGLCWFLWFPTVFWLFSVISMEFRLVYCTFACVWSLFLWSSVNFLGFHGTFSCEFSEVPLLFTIFPYFSIFFPITFSLVFDFFCFQRSKQPTPGLPEVSLRLRRPTWASHRKASSLRLKQRSETVQWDPRCRGFRL